MTPNWRDIQEQAEKFTLEWRDTKEERSWAQAFWTDFFRIFGVGPRSLGIFEERVKMLRGNTGRIDFYMPGMFLVEHKSQGESLDSAFLQAAGYIDSLREDDKPHYVVVSDFARFRMYDLEARTNVEFTLAELPAHTQRFAFLMNQAVREPREQEPIDVKAVRAIGKLHSALKSSNYTPEHLSPLLTRIVFCCFADDTGIFEQESLLRYLEENTKPDGSDIGAHLNAIFEVLNMKEDKRQSNIHPTLENLPYVNGGLFAERLNTVFASREIRDTLLKCMEFDWKGISPAVFGSMFQSVMNEKERHDLGAHYTSEANILKVIGGLFLEDLKDELGSAKTNKEKLNVLWDKIAKVTLLDPACGCGNFLVIAYRELRLIENVIIERLYKHGTSKVDAGHMVLPMEVNIKKLSKLTVENMYGIELDPFPAEVAKLSLWLMDHLMNAELGRLFGKVYKKLPLTEAPHIVQGNALRIDWEMVVPKEKLTHILGNPPYLGYKQQQPDQKTDMEMACGDVEGTGVLDYVGGWFLKAAKLIQGTQIAVAFVSTNSITQGEQVAALWKPMTERFGVKISFAHQTFKWTNEATGKAAVYCVIIGFSLHSPAKSTLHSYVKVQGQPQEMKVSHINPYLVDAPTVFLEKRLIPISSEAPQMVYGNEPREGGMLLLDSVERERVISEYPQLGQWIRKFVSADDFINNTTRYCYWLIGAVPEILRLPPLRERLAAVRVFRETSKQKAAHDAKDTPALFVSIRQADSSYLLIPIVSSENRKYVPFGYMDGSVITSNANFMLPNASLWHFGILESKMHMVWMGAVCGRLESRYRYSNTIVYNNFPWPENPTETHKKLVEGSAQAVLDVRANHPNSTLADLYNPDTMPIDLLKAHQALDRAVDVCYGARVFKTESERLEFLFEQYSSLVSKEHAKLKSKARKAKKSRFEKL